MPTYCSTTRTMGLAVQRRWFYSIICAQQHHFVCFPVVFLYPLQHYRLLDSRVSGLDCSLTTVHGSDVVIFPPCFVVLSCSVSLSLSYFSALVESFTVESLLSLALGAPACLGFHFRHVAVTLSNGDCIANDAIVFGGNESGFV